MYFTDRGIEELVARRGGEDVNVDRLGDRLRAFVDAYPEFETAIDRTTSKEQHRKPDAGKQHDESCVEQPRGGRDG